MATRTKRAPRVKPDLYQVVTDRLITLLESGVAPWQRNYNQYGLASNYATGHTYTGINAFLLNCFPQFPIPLYLTYKQAQGLGGQVRKGSKAKTVYFFKTIYKDADGNSLNPDHAAALTASGRKVQHFPMPRTFHLFNVADVDGIDFDIPELAEQPHQPVEQCEAFLASLASVPPIVHDRRDHAFYSVTNDFINLPPIASYRDAAAYYKTAFHELIHATGAANRLSRPGITLPPEQRRPGSPAYALEELTAELGAAYLCQMAGINSQPLEENSAAYLDAFLDHLRQDRRFLFQAATAAQKAIDFLLKPAITV